MIPIVINQLDIFYISYDEPNCEENWANLLNIAPWAKRVHGVKGFDAAHKACAEQSETEYFITVDGDNIVAPIFLDQSFTMPDEYKDCVLSWASTNEINGLVYGNGGLKMWPKEATLKMKTHEAAEDPRLALDFCWDDKYIQMNNVYSTTHPNGSAYQAFRAGFREGCKMTVHSGEKTDLTQFDTSIHHKNLKRLLVWMSVGADVEYGLYAIMGARMGLIQANFNPDFDVNNIRDYEWFKNYWMANNFHMDLTEAELQYLIIKYGRHINKMTGLPMELLTPEQSRFFKYVYEPPKRTHIIRTEIAADNEGI